MDIVTMSKFMPEVLMIGFNYVVNVEIVLLQVYNSLMKLLSNRKTSFLIETVISILRQIQLPSSDNIDTRTLNLNFANTSLLTIIR